MPSKAFRKLVHGRKPHPTDYLPTPFGSYIKHLSQPHYRNTYPARNPNHSVKTLLQITNDHRTTNNLPKLRISQTLCAIARRHTVYQASHRTMSHTGSGGSGLGDRFRAGGYRFRVAAENVAVGQKSAEWVMKSWWGSKGHRKNILKRDVVDMGAWVVERGGKCYWTQVFGRRR